MNCSKMLIKNASWAGEGDCQARNDSPLPSGSNDKTRICSIVPISFTNTHAPERMIFLTLAIALCINNQHSVTEVHFLVIRNCFNKEH